MEKDYYKFLDELLDHYKSIQGRTSQAQDNDTRTKIISDNNMTMAEYGEAYRKLEKENLIRTTLSHEKGAQMITFEGYCFIQDGKFKHKRKIEKVSYLFKRINIIIVTIAALFAIAYYGISISKDIFEEPKKKLPIVR